MKIVLRYPDQSRTSVRLAATKRLDSLRKLLPDGVYMKYGNKRIQTKIHTLKEIFKDGALVDVVYKKSKKRVLSNKVEKSNERCMITLDEDEDRAQMSCSHAITPQALYEYCTREANSGKKCITCPYRFNDKGDSCGQEWPMEEIKRCACLTKDEATRIRVKLSQSKIKFEKSVFTKRCYPDDLTICMLQKTGFKEISSVKKCPARRACPKCLCLIDHVGGCREMVCKYPVCQYVFCFICLNDYSMCSRDCKPAPIQFS